MKKYLPFVALLLGLVYLGSTLRERAPASDFELGEFGRLPVLKNGRLKPLDTVARSSLLQFQGRQRISEPAGQNPLPSTPSAWLADVLFDSARADTYPVFRIDSPELLDLMGITAADTRVEYSGKFKQAMALVGFLPSQRSRFSFEQLRPKFEELERQSQLASDIDAQARTPFQRAAVQLHVNLIQYHQLKHAVMIPGTRDFLGELMSFQQALPTGIAAVRARQAGDVHNEAAFQAMIDLGRRYDFLSQSSNLLPIPPPPGEADPDAWKNTGRALLDTFETGRVDPGVLAYAGLGHAWRHQQPAQFNEILRLYRAEIQQHHAARLAKSDAETRFNAAAPFYSSMVLYVLAFLLAVFSWLKWPDILGRSAFWLIVLAFVATTAGIATRMWLEGRPPVTNLYSSALFVGWGSVGLCLMLEAIYRNAVGSVAAGLIGFGTLLIAHHLSLSGDTLEMMRAVLDSNFWLATHVIVITIGYSATFLAGFLAIIYVLRGVLTSSLDRATAVALDRMVYGIVCFGTLFSLIGTVLGGIWADQSWGRFWGWDPKENGALIIVLWNAIILHARWGGLVRSRGIMNLAIFGNIVTSWSWFGTNMLGIGLHSYGFMDAAFWALSAFIASQLAIIAIGCLPPERWRSFARLAA